MAESLPTSGFWGNLTATIDWCEANYEVTHYIAEFWNTVSNLVMILFPLYGIYWATKQKTSKKFNSFRVTNSMVACHLGLCLVGLGSWMFHMTLLYPMQLLDELPMVFGSGILIFAHYDLLLSAFLIEQQSRRSRYSKNKSFFYKIFISRPTIGILIAMYCISFAYIYLYVWKNPIFHEIAYGIQVFTIICLSILNIKQYKFSKRLWALSMFYYGLGFALWNLDNNFCDYLKSSRVKLESLFGLTEVNLKEFNLKAVLLNVFVVSLKSVTEFHCLWHLFTGYASFLCILFLTELSYEHHLKTANITSQRRPVSSKYFNMYYYLTSIENETSKSIKSTKSK